MTELPEASFSHQEQIGMPNWGHVSIFVAVKTQIPEGGDRQAHNQYVADVGSPYTRERVERVAVGLGIWAGMSDADTFKAEQPELVPGGLVRVTYSMSERIAFPDRSQINLFDSCNEWVERGLEIATLRELTTEVNRLMSTKRALVQANPRPWKDNA